LCAYFGCFCGFSEKSLELDLFPKVGTGVASLVPETVFIE
jgi:hypothetical protein